MMKKAALALTLFALVSAVPGSASADDVYQVIVKRQEQKKTSQWSLAEWLATKDRMRLMDMWLALHTPTPFEFFLGGNTQFGSYGRNGDAYKGAMWQIAGYASIFGVEFQHDQSGTSINNLLLHLRVFGYHNQTTNLTLEGGLRTRGGDGEFRSPVFGTSLTIYLIKYFGLDGLWRHIFTSSSNSLGYTISGTRFEANAFIDFNFVRLYGGYFHEQETASSDPYQQYFPTRSGGVAGVKLFF